MSKFDQTAFNQFVIDNDVYGFFDKPITLKSGRQSHFYANWRTVVEDVWLTEKLIQFVLAFVSAQNIEVDTFYGVPEGATKLGVLCQYQWAKQQANYGRGSHALAMGRAKPKEHGAPKDRLFVGAPRGNVVVLEDVTTTGGSSLNAISSLQENGIEVSALVSLTNRMEKRADCSSVSQAVEKLGVRFYHMSSAIELLPLVFQKIDPGEDITRAIQAEFDQYGLQPLVLIN